MKKYSGLSMVISPILILLLSTDIQSATACEPGIDHWFLETFSVENTDLPESVLIQTDRNDSESGYLLIQNSSEVPLYILPLAAEPANIVEEAPGLALYRLPSARFSQSLPLYLDQLIQLDPQLPDQRRMEFSPPPADVEIPPEDKSALLLVYGDQLIKVPFKVSYRINQNFYVFDCNAWWDSMEATEAARVETAQTAERQSQQAPIGNLTTVLMPVVIFLGVVVILVISIATQRQQSE